MLECLIIGDSIAQGIANHRPECVEYAQVGHTSRQANRAYRTRRLSADTVVISLGTNDHRYVDTYGELIQLRQNIKSKNVIWIMPNAVNPNSGTDISIVQASIDSIAGAHNDTIVHLPKPMADRYHPTGAGYKNLADRTRR
jgi:lysophospholipase L1-like esterase